MMPFSRIRTSSVTNFPLTKEQKGTLRESSKIDVMLNQGHATIEMHEGKEFTVYIHGHDRPPIAVSITKIRKKDGGTVVTLERRCGE